MNWLLITVAIIFLAGFLFGIFRGGIRIAVSLAATVVTLILVFILTPYVSKAIYNFTPIDESIEQRAQNAMSSLVASTSLEGLGINEDTIESLLQQYGISERALQQAGISVDDILEGKVSGADLEKYGIPGDILNGNASEDGSETDLSALEIPRQVQMSAIQNTEGIPAIFKDLLTENNNNEVYDLLEVTSFPEYVAKYLAKIVINMVSFLATFVLVTIILRAVIFALDIVSELPVLGWINRMIGAVVGLIIALLVVDVIFVGITLLYTTGIGETMFALIDSSSFLTFLYDHNLVMNLATAFR